MLQVIKIFFTTNVLYEKNIFMLRFAEEHM